MIFVAFAVSMSFNLLLAVLFFKQSVLVSQRLDQAHERTTEYTKGLVDRLMAVDYGTFKAYQQLENQAVDELLRIPTEPDLTVVMGPDRGGFGSKLGLRALSEREDDESELLSEIPQ